jgi:hypothetical protein
MQFKNPKSKNWLKLKEISRNKRCHICYSPLKKTGVYMWSANKRDCTGIKCFNCLTIYSPTFAILEMGIPSSVGYA